MPSVRSGPVLGVLGGIASGKSECARLLAGSKGTVISADALVAEAYAEPELQDRIRTHFGAQALDRSGAPNRAFLAELVFSEPMQRRLLESWIHPLVRAKIQNELAAAHGEGKRPIVLDVPLLLENDAEHQLVGLCDALVFVDADLEARDRRAVQERGWRSGEVQRRESTQMPLARKRARADYVIENNGSRSELQKSVQALRESLGLP
jgi:dephospho-CoA kinase